MRHAFFIADNEDAAAQACHGLEEYQGGSYFTSAGWAIDGREMSRQVLDGLNACLFVLEWDLRSRGWEHDPCPPMGTDIIPFIIDDRQNAILFTRNARSIELVTDRAEGALLTFLAAMVEGNQVRNPSPEFRATGQNILQFMGQARKYREAPDSAQRGKVFNSI